MWLNNKDGTTILTVVLTIFCSSPTDPSIGTQPLDGPDRHRFFDTGVRAPAGRRQVHRIRQVHRQLRVLYCRVQGDQSVGGDEKRAAVHVGHEKLFAQTRWEGVPEGCGKRAKPGIRVFLFSFYPYRILWSPRRSIILAASCRRAHMWNILSNSARVFCPQLKPTEFLNLDVILEGVMNRLVLKELREHIYSLLVDEYVNNGSVPSMVENIHYAKSKNIQDFAVRVRAWISYV